VKLNWVKLRWGYLCVFFFSLKAEGASWVSSFLSLLVVGRTSPCATWVGKGCLTPFSPLPSLVCLTCLLTSSYQRQKPSRAKDFPCYRACKTPGVTGPLAARRRKKNSPSFPNPWNPESGGRTPRGRWEGMGGWGWLPSLSSA